MSGVSMQSTLGLLAVNCRYYDPDTKDYVRCARTGMPPFCERCHRRVTIDPNQGLAMDWSKVEEEAEEDEDL